MLFNLPSLDSLYDGYTHSLRVMLIILIFFIAQKNPKYNKMKKISDENGFKNRKFRF